MTDFKGKKIVLTGASRGVGYEASKLFLAAGAEIIGTGRDAARLEKTAAELQKLGSFTPFLADFDSPAAPGALSDFVHAQWGSLDLLLNNAAVQTYRSDWREEGLELLNEQWRCNVFAQHELIFITAPCDSLHFCNEQIPLSKRIEKTISKQEKKFFYLKRRNHKIIKQAKEWFPLIEPILASYGIPEDFKYLKK